jgi:hypothetical protein
MVVRVYKAFIHVHSSHFLLFQKRSKSVSSASQKVFLNPELGEADPGGLGAYPQQNSTLSHFLLFQKRSKSVSSASQKVSLTQNSAKPTQGVWGRVPSKTALSHFLLFQKEAKALVHGAGSKHI